MGLAKQFIIQGTEIVMSTRLNFKLQVPVNFLPLTRFLADLWNVTVLLTPIYFSKVNLLLYCDLQYPADLSSSVQSGLDLLLGFLSWAPEIFSICLSHPWRRILNHFLK